VPVAVHVPAVRVALPVLTVDQVALVVVKFPVPPTPFPNPAAVSQ